MAQEPRLSRSGNMDSSSVLGTSDLSSPANLNFFRQPLAPILTVAGVAVLVVLAVTFTRVTGELASLWGASGLAAVVWLRAGRGLGFDLAFGGLVLIGIVAGELLVGRGVLLSTCLGFFNLVEILLFVVLARRHLPGLSVGSVVGVARLFAISLVASLMASGLMALVSYFSIIDFKAGLFGWWSAHALGLALIGVFGLSLTRRNLTNLLRPLRLFEAVVLVSLIVAGTYVIFGQLQLPYSFLLMPLIVMMAVRFRVVGTAFCLILIMVIAMEGTNMGMGPYRLFPVEFASLVVHLLILFGYAPLLLVAALLEEREQLDILAREGRKRAETASAAKSRLLANVAHEIKSPVSGIIGIGELWAAGQLGQVSAAQLEMAEMLVKTARQTEALAHDLLDVAHAESGAIRVDIRPTDISGVIEDVRRTMLLRSETARVPVEVMIEEEALVAMADSHRLSQVIGNLVSNAVKYGGQGGSVQLCALRNSGWVRIEVRDQGPGLSLEKQAQLFEPFNRLGLERSSIEGHGIGLALAKRLTELQGGQIGVISKPGHGATFWIELAPA